MVRSVPTPVNGAGAGTLPVTSRYGWYYGSYPFTNSPGKFVELKDTIRSFKAICDGEYDHLPEAAFYMVGSIDMAVEKAQRLAAEAA